MNPERFRRLQSAFHQALERPPETRDAFIDEVSAGDDEFRRELASLLAKHREDDRFLETALLELDSPLLEGQSLGPYRVGREIGRGGMGVVYLARDTRLGRQVALKALAPALVFDLRQQDRFRREAVVAASLSHPAIATVYALEEFRGRFYIVTEYVPGEPLRVEMENAPLPVERVLDVARQVADGLAAAHERGIVHRDLKPENIVRIADGRLKIVDFGLAIGPGAGFPDRRLTRTGALLGTPAYMSPEQLRGEPVDFRSDLFSLGILLYELLTGEHPFDGGTAWGTSARILEGEPRGRGRLRERAPGLDAIILKCLEKDPEDRFASTREIVTELERIAGHPRPRLAARNVGPPLRVLTDQDDASGLPSHWWVFHQSAVMALYTVMVILLFMVQRQYQGPLLFGCAFLALACGIWNGAMRAHLLFTSQFNRGAIREEVGRTARLIRAVDLAFTLALLAAAAGVLPASQPWAAAFASVGLCYAVVFLVVEPTTVRSVFSDRNAG